MGSEIGTISFAWPLHWSYMVGALQFTGKSISSFPVFRVHPISGPNPTRPQALRWWTWISLGMFHRNLQETMGFPLKYGVFLRKTNNSCGFQQTGRLTSGETSQRKWHGNLSVTVPCWAAQGHHPSAKTLEFTHWKDHFLGGTLFLDKPTCRVM